MGFVRTVLGFSFTVFSVFAFLPFGLPAFVLSFLGLRKPMSWVSYKCAQLWAKVIIAITGCKLEVQGRENIPVRGGVCFVSNHGGVFDIVLALALIGRPVGCIAKKELFLVPFFNLWIYILGGLFIDRRKIRNALKTINNGIEKIRKGGSILIFPEGTRSKGRGLLPFRSGALKLAINSLSPVVPIAITGSYEVFEKNMRVKVVPVWVTFCPPVITAEMSSEDRRHKLADHVRSVIEAALEKHC